MTIAYHYCDQHAFHAICSSRTLRFSDLHFMNDCMELTWANRILGTAAVALEKREPNVEFDIEPHVRIAAALDSFKAKCVPTAFCLSKKRDQLSQWRGYADDGKGFAIGFDLDVLKQLPASQVELEYDEGNQQAVAAKFLESFVEQHDKLTNEEVRQRCHDLYLLLAKFKQPSFVEEAEVRLLHVLERRNSDGAIKILPTDCFAFGKKAVSPDVQFRMKAGAPVPFVDIPFQENDSQSPLKEVMLGPMNFTRAESVEQFLTTIGYDAVSVSRSASSYRNPETF